MPCNPIVRISRATVQRAAVHSFAAELACGFRQVSLRGLAKVRAEWTSICTAHDALELIKARPA